MLQDFFFPVGMRLDINNIFSCFLKFSPGSLYYLLDKFWETGIQ